LIISVTLNAAIDRTVAVPNFRLGHRHRSVESRTAPGGKGVNVARSLAALGRPVVVTGLAGGTNGDRVVRSLEAEGLLTDFIKIAEETRINLAVVDPTSGDQTEINERGPEVQPDELEEFVERLEYLARGARLCVLAGSLPPGVEVDFYGRLVGVLDELGVTVVLDAEGEAMSAGMKAGPAMVTPNRLEAEELVGREFESRDELFDVLGELLDLGPRQAAITLPEGCVAAIDDGQVRQTVEVTIEPLEPVSTVGSGDAFVAGYVAGIYDGMSPVESLSYAVASGAESTQHLGAGRVDRDQVETLVEQVRVEPVETRAGV